MFEKLQFKAQQTCVALKNPYQSVDEVYPNIINKWPNSADFWYFGVKKGLHFSSVFYEKMSDISCFQHTVDRASSGGRAVDLCLKNPISGGAMTGSSSGTAINVLTHINDFGIGSDGGGSVLAPAISTNLFSFIHPCFLKEMLIQPLGKKESTDGIWFEPSIGIMARNFNMLSRIIKHFIGIEKLTKVNDIVVKSDVAQNTAVEIFNWEVRNFDYKYVLPRDIMQEKLLELLTICDVVVSKEGPIDVKGLGDSIFGNFDEKTAQYQHSACKGFVRVANMIGAAAITVPAKEFATGYVLISKSDSASVTKLMTIAQAIIYQPNALIERYFGNLNQYF